MPQKTKKTNSDKPSKKKQPSVSKLKKKFWTVFSLYIRLRDSDENGMCTCVTCGKVKHYKKGIHAGHFIAGRSNGILFDERCVHAQCNYCNTYLGGNGARYYKYMLKHYGQEVIDELMKQADSTVSFSIEELEQRIEHYKVKIKELENNKLF